MPSTSASVQQPESREAKRAALGRLGLNLPRNPQESSNQAVLPIPAEDAAASRPERVIEYFPSNVPHHFFVPLEGELPVPVSHGEAVAEMCFERPWLMPVACVRSKDEVLDALAAKFLRERRSDVYDDIAAHLDGSPVAVEIPLEGEL